MSSPNYTEICFPVYRPMNKKKKNNYLIIISYKYITVVGNIDNNNCIHLWVVPIVYK